MSSISQAVAGHPSVKVRGQW